MNKNIMPSAGPLAYISPVIEFAEPGDKLKTFVDQVLWRPGDGSCC